MSFLNPATQETLELYNLLTIGCSINIEELEYFEAMRLIHLKREIDKEEEKKIKNKMR